MENQIDKTKKIVFTISNPEPFPKHNIEVGQPDYETDDYEKLYNFIEQRIVTEAANTPAVLEDFLNEFKIDINNCWIGVNVPKQALNPSWKHDKPGDVDLVIGNFRQDKTTPDYSNIVGVQVKIRKVESDNDIKKGFASKNDSAGQTHYTMLMGFHQTILLHVFVKNPSDKPISFTNLWNNLINENFYERVANASYPLIANKIERELWGYGWISWGQAYKSDFRKNFNINFNISHKPPFDPLKDNNEIIDARKLLTKNIDLLINRKKIFKYPHIFYE